MEQSFKTHEPVDGLDEAASRRVSRGIMQALEQGRLTPGQRLVETALAVEYGVGRNAVREAVQWLAAHGVIEITRHRSAALRRLDEAGTRDVLDVAEAVIGLLVRAAARQFAAPQHGDLLHGALAEVEAADVPGFARARRHFYGALLTIGGSGELRRLLPAEGLHILLAQYPEVVARRQALDDFRAMAAAVAANDAEHGQALGRAHIGRLRRAVLTQRHIVPQFIDSGSGAKARAAAGASEHGSKPREGNSNEER